MLTELALIATHVAPAEGGATSTEACISFYDVHTHSPSSFQSASISTNALSTTTTSLSGLSILKKSSSQPNCVAVSPTHIFAAQSDKSTLSVYNRAKGNLETSLPLPEQISGVACSKNGGLVATGSVNGRLNIWETASGRYTSTEPLHLQKVTAITFSSDSQLLLTGSADSNIHVFSLPLLLDPKSDRRPLRTLERHRGEITSIAFARGSGPASMCITASKDSTAVLWNPYDGNLLRTFMFSLSPTCIALDPADRGFYAGFEDGSVQMVEFATAVSNGSNSNGQLEFSVNGAAVAAGGVNGTTDMDHDGLAVANSSNNTADYANPVFASDDRNIPISVDGNSRWKAEGYNSAVQCIGVVFEGNYVLTGDSAGVVSIWDVATGHLLRVLARHKASVTNLKILPPTGFPPSPLGHREAKDTTIQTTLVAPRYNAVVRATSSLSREDDVGADGGLPPITMGFKGSIPPSDFSPYTRESTNGSGGDRDIFSISADMDALRKGVRAFCSLNTATTINIPIMAATQDFVPLDSGSSASAGGDFEKVERLEKELADMHSKYERLSKIHKQTWEEHSKFMMAVDAEKAEKGE